MINNWIKCSIKDLVKIQNGYAFKSERFVKNEIPVIKISSINNNQIIIDNSETYPSINICEDFIVKKNDILIAMSGATTGKVGVYCHNNIAYLNQRVCKFVIKSNKFHYDYLRFWLNSDLFRLQMNTCLAAGAQPNLSPKQIGNMDISLPSEKNEQELITKQLIDIDSLIENLKKLIEKKKNIKLGTMQELLTGKKRLPGFTKEWKLISINKIGGIYSGLTGKTKKDFGWGNSKYVTFLNVLNNRILKTDIFASVNINESQNFIKYGDILFNTSSETPEEVALCSTLDSEINEDVAINSFCFGFRVFDTKKYYPLFIVDYFRSNSGRKQIIEIAQGSTRYNLSKDYFLNLEIPFPEYDEQKSISDTITDMEKEIHNLEQQLNKYKHIKQGMMEQLLTGKIRLV